MTITWWADVDEAILQCVADARGPVMLGDISRRVGIPETAVASLVAMLASEGKIAIRAVERVGSLEGL